LKNATLASGQTEVRESHSGRGAGAAQAAGRVTFVGSGDFHNELKRRVEAYFERTGKRPRDSVALYVKSAIIVACFAGIYVLLTFFIESWWVAVPLAMLLGVATAGIGFNIMHDGGHEAYSSSRAVNRITASMLDLIGSSSYLWRWRHGIFHHTYVNITGLDADIDQGGLRRMTQYQPWHPLHRWQHLYVWPLYAVMAVKWQLYDDFHETLAGRIATHPVPRPRGWDLAVFVGGKLVFLSLAFGIPLLIHPWWVVVIYYIVVSSVLSVLLSVVFQIAHCVDNASFPPPPVGSVQLDKEWAVHQVETTVDFSRRSRIAAWLLGGLNFQVEHHLFPRISHVHYPALSKVVEDACREFGVRYTEHKTFWHGIASHYRWLRQMGSGPSAI
jgi:linoleoyl-CoA desaturase